MIEINLFNEAHMILIYMIVIKRFSNARFKI